MAQDGGPTTGMLCIACQKVLEEHPQIAPLHGALCYRGSNLHSALELHPTNPEVARELIRNAILGHARNGSSGHTSNTQCGLIRQVCEMLEIKTLDQIQVLTMEEIRNISANVDILWEQLVNDIEN